jgi:transcription factor SFP1
MSSAVPIDISYQRNAQFQSQPQQRFRRESMAHSQGMGGISWGGMSVGSWLRDEVIFNNMPPPPVSMSPMNSSSYLASLEADFCRDYSCCGQLLPTLHDLLRHYEEAHISPSPPVEPPVMRRMQSLEAVSTNEVFLSPISSNTATPMMMDEDDDMCIDDPARHLYVMERGEHKPFKCPVIGCEKTYKNQNGLKYHRMHGHQNQTLHLNDDGTYSIIDPLSNTPYPEGMGMEKDKPYRCEVCGKRYKNLNGLKYHRGHSTH